MTVRIAVNGFGRIGRNFFRALLKRKPDDIEFVAVNDLTDSDILAHLLKYDSSHGVLDADIKVSEEGLAVNGTSFKVLAEREPEKLPWKKLGIDVVIEATGLFTDRPSADKHLAAGARKVVFTAPASSAEDTDITIVMGVNETEYDKSKHNIISNGSCTTNCVVPMAKVLMDSFGIEQGFMTTVHAYTTEQQLQDQVAMTRKGKPDLRRMRAAGVNIVPASTGAARATSLVIPELKGKLDGMAFRVPVPDGSVTDLVCVLSRETSRDEVNEAFLQASASDRLRGILSYTEDPIVSSDIIGNSHSCIIDGASTMTLRNQVKVIGWYDNEWGYSNRLIDIVPVVAG